MATLKDVAKLANVDVSTVSRALNNNSYVHPDTKERIFDAVKELSYHPNVIAKGLRNGKTHTIAFIAPHISDSVYSEMLPAISDEARKLNYQCVLCTTVDDSNTEKEILSRLRDGLVDGIIISSTGRNNRLLTDIRASGVSVLQVIRKQDEKISSIVADYYKNSYDAVKYLYSKGCRHLGLIIGNLALHTYMERYNGFLKALKEVGIEGTAVMDDERPFSFSYGQKCTKKLLEDHPEIDGVIASLDIQGLGAQRVLKILGKKVPEDVKLISLTGISLGSYLETTMTSMELPAMEIGREAVSTLIRDIEMKEETRSVKHIVYQSTLVEREST